MREFKSRVSNSLGAFFITTGSYLALLYLLLSFTINFKLNQITLWGWSIMAFFYCVLCYCYAGFVNNDILLFDNRIEVVNKRPLFKRYIVLQFDKIESVKFRHEWTETFTKNIKFTFIKYIASEFLAPFFFPSDYKWVKITADKSYKIYCFGIEMDFFDNEGPLFEELFKELAEKGINVSWTDISDVYYLHMEMSVKSKNQ